MVKALLLLSLSGCTPGGTADSTPACGPLRVASWNLLHGYLDEDPDAQPFDRVEERLALAGPALAEDGLAALMLQEVVMGATDGYPDTAEILRVAQGEAWSLTFGDLFGTEPASSGNGWGQAILTCYEVLEANNHVLTTTSGTPRSVLHTRVSVEGDEVDLFDAHTSGNGAIEVEDVLGFVEELGGDRIVLGGDFNIADDEEGMEVLEDAGFTDVIGEPCLVEGGPTCTNSTIPLGEEGNRSDQRIDYLWVRGLEVVEAEVLFTSPMETSEGVLWVSDHLPVVATLD